jgi:ribonuclease HI
VLVGLFNGCLTQGYCPQHFRESKTIALRKPGKDDYSVPKAWRPITLLNTLGKLLEAIIAARLSQAAEAYNLLPASHFGGRKGQSTETAIHALLEVIYSAWEQGKTASMLLMDVAQAYPNVSHLRLAHNLRRRRIGKAYIDWILCFLQHRYTTLVVGAHTQPRSLVDTGIPQGSPLSPILYLFYNADLVEDLDQGPTRCFGYIDDIDLIACGDSAEANCDTLRHAFRQAKEWAKKHASVFEAKKFRIIHFERLATRQAALQAIEAAQDPSTNLGPGITVQGHYVQAEFAAKFLGVTLDRHLTFEPHLRHVETAASKRLQAISAVAGGTWGLQVSDLQKIYTACIASVALYACSAWLATNQRGTSWRYTRQLRALEQLQKNAAKAISGGFRTVSKDAFDAELFLMPIKIRARMQRTMALARIASSPAYKRIVANRAHHRRRNQDLRSPLETAEEEFQLATDIDPQDMEIRAPFAVPPWWTPPNIQIEGSVLAALINHEKCIALQPNALRFYTDGSGIDGHVGAAAVCPQTSSRCQAYLGSEKECTVPAAELVGLTLALEAAGSLSKDRDIIIFTDNQGALKTLQKPQGASGQYIVRHIIELLKGLKARTTLHWIPAHKGIPGNEEADRLAKEATGWRKNGNRGPQAPLYALVKPLQSAITRWAKQKAKTDWERAWAGARHGRLLRQLLPAVNRKTLQLYQGLNKELSATLIQMRTGKIRLRQYLHSIQAADSALCPCGAAPQTVEHILMECNLFDNLRTTTWNGREHIPRRLTEFLGEQEQARRSAMFMVGTRLLRAPSPADSSASGDTSERTLTPHYP